VDGREVHERENRITKIEKEVNIPATERGDP
jgi:hypothetical protein